MNRIFFTGAAILFGASCAFTIDDPCQEYVDYVCDCHGEDPAFSCSSISLTYSDAGEEYATECASAHDELLTQDDLSGFECMSEVGDTGDTSYTSYTDTAASTL